MANFTLTQSGPAVQGDLNIIEGVAPVYSASSAYAVGDRVRYDNALYQCKTAIPSGEAWNAAHWDAVTINQALNSKVEGVVLNSDALPISGHKVTLTTDTLNTALFDITDVPLDDD